MPAPSIPLGAFDLLRPIARGGMARVWLARHRKQGISVAIKVLTGRSALHADFVRRFRAEVRAVAALDHPGVVMILDHGHVDDAAARRAGELLVAGAPWLAMEFVSGGTLAQLRPPLAWPTVKAIILALLDALGHAHARDVIHRDLKPANVLVTRPGDLRRGPLRLTDFGIAWAGGPDVDDDEDRVVGTPSYMAPEQIRGEWRDFGPWTDLYALGCLAWWLTTGKAPFTKNRRDVESVLAAHLHDPVPEYMPKVDVPPLFHEWLSRLLAKDWRQRFGFAADAAESLRQLGDPEGEEDEVPDTEATLIDPSFPRADSDPSSMPTLTSSQVSSWLSEETPVPATQATLPAHRPWVASVPEDWRSPEPKATPIQLVGAGLSLYGLRAIRLAGRVEERDQLWTEFKKVAVSGRARVALVRGPAGTGKSRLVEWLSQRGHELGVLHTCKASFSREKAPGEALRQMANDYVRAHGLSRVEVQERALAFLQQHGGGKEPDEVQVLTELMCPATEEDLRAGLQAVRLTRPREYYMGTANAFYRVSRDRPLLAWFDDIQWGQHGIRLALEVLRSQSEHPFPCLLVMTLRDEALEEESDEARQLARLMALGATEIRLGSLAPTVHRELVRGLLGLDADLAARVEERTRGNPLFAVQLVGSWVHDGTLEVGEGGFRLKAGARAVLPDDLHSMWSAQVSRVLAEYPEQVQTYLEVAACLGSEVDGREWGRACDDPEGHFSGRFPTEERLRAALIERLATLHLVVGTPQRWTFVHGMLQESLLRTAHEAGRLAGHHLSCAATLASQGEAPEVAERLGRHLVEAGRVDQAVEPLLRGVEHRLVTVGASPARRLLRTVEQAMGRLALAPSDARWGRLWTAQARVAFELGELTEALTHAQRARAAATANGWGEEKRVAMLAEGRLLLRLSRREEARSMFEHLEVEARSQGDGARRGAALAGLARLAWRSRDAAATIELQDKALAAFSASLQHAVGNQQNEQRAEYAQLLIERGRSAQALSERDVARQMFRQALREFEGLGSGVGSAECLDRLGGLAAADGDDAQAIELFRRALSRYEALGSERAFVCRMQLVQAVLRRRPGAAWSIAQRVEPFLARLAPDSQPAANAGLQLLRASLEARTDAFDRDLPKLVVAVTALSRSQDGVAGTMLAWMAQLSGEAWRAHGDDRRAAMALRGASGIWQFLGRREQVAYIESLLSTA